MRLFKSLPFAVVMLVSGPGPVQADEDAGRSRPLSEVGISASVGTGVLVFSRGAAVATIDPGIAWSAGVIVGSRKSVGFGFSYVGSVHDVDGADLNDAAILVGQGFEGILRVHFMPTEWQPYVGIGFAWKHYELLDATSSTYSMRHSDSVVEAPIMVGLVYHRGVLLADVSLSYRPAFDSELMSRGGDASLTSWGISAGVGLEL
jgi:hypothetical protein